MQRIRYTHTEAHVRLMERKATLYRHYVSGLLSRSDYHSEVALVHREYYLATRSIWSRIATVTRLWVSDIGQSRKAV